MKEIKEQIVKMCDLISQKTEEKNLGTSNEILQLSEAILNMVKAEEIISLRNLITSNHS